MALVFGTDGVRGHVGSDIDEEKIVSLGIAASRHLNTKRVYLGRDTRESSFVLAAALKQGLINIDFSGSAFHNKVAYHDFEGVTLRNDECERIANDLGDKSVMILRNHGLLTCGKSISEAFMLMYYLDRACKTQIDAESTGEKLIIPTNNINLGF